MLTFVLPEKYETQRVHCGVEAIHAETLRQGLPHRVIHAPVNDLPSKNPGLIMISFKQYFKNLGVFSRWFGQLRKKGWIISIYHIDAPWNNGLSEFRWKLIKNLFWPFDIFFTHAVENDAPRTKSIVYLPNASGVELIDVTESQPVYDIGFCGNFKARNKEHAKRIRLLEEYGQAFRKAGIRFVTRQDDGQMSTWLNHARACWLQLSIGSAADKPDRMSRGLPARVYGFSCIGALTLIEPRGHLADDFTDEGQLPVYETVDDCVAIIRQLLAEKEALNTRRRKLLTYSRARHLYSHRLDKLLQVCRDSGLDMSYESGSLVQNKKEPIP